IKRRREAAEQMRSGQRVELAEKEEQEAKMLQAYLPPQLDETDVRALVREAIQAGAADLGSVMKAVMPKVKGRFEGKELNRIVREELGCPDVSRAAPPVLRGPARAPGSPARTEASARSYRDRGPRSRSSRAGFPDPSRRTRARAPL